MRKHRAAFRFDCRDRFGLPLSAVRGLAASEAWAILHGLTVDSRSHVYAALTGQTFQGSQGDLAIVLLAQAVLNMGKRAHERPVKLPNPYLGAESKKSKAEYVPPRERERLRATLRRYSSIPE